MDPSRIEAIMEIDPPRNKKEVQYFIGRNNFLRRFIQNLAEILRAITNMLRKERKIKWNAKEKRSFNELKSSLNHSPLLASPDFTKEFITFSFSSEHTIAAVLMQENKEGYEHPIAFFSRVLRDASLKYNIMEKQAFSLLKALKYFRVYIFHSHIISFVPNAVVKDILSQNGHEGRRGKWIVVILEYDIEINLTKLIKGQGLAKLMDKSNLHALNINFIIALDGDEEYVRQGSKIFVISPWHTNIFYVLQHLQAPPGLTKTKARFLKLEVVKFGILDQALYWKDAGGILLSCLLEDEVDKMMEEFHKGDCGGHIF